MSPAAVSGGISGLLSSLAASRGSSPAVVQRGKTTTFAELEEDCVRLAAGLARFGIGPGERTVLMVPPGPDFFSLCFALFRIGAVPVLVDPGMGLESLGRCLEEAEPGAFIGAPKAHLGRLLKGWGKKTVRKLVTAGPRWGWGGETLDGLRRLGITATLRVSALPAGSPAAILFTSGSTGIPKGAVYTHEIFSAQVRMLAELFKIEPGGASVPTFPLFALFDVALGLTAHLPDMDFTRPGQVDPMEIIRVVRESGAVQLFGSPALLDRVGRYGEARGTRLPSLRRVLSAGAPVPARVVERFAGLLSPGAEIYTPYGATEALPVCVMRGGEILSETGAMSFEGAGTCVGRPAPGMEVRLIRITETPIPAWEESLRVREGDVGEIVAGGPVVTPEYFRRPEATALAKIRGSRGEILHRMGDLGRLDPAGRLWFVGRKSQRIQTAAGTLFTVACEGVFNAHPAVRRTALVGVGKPGAQEPVLCVELEAGASPDLERLRRELLTLGASQAQTRDIRTILFHDGFPVDIRHNAKIFREKLAVWACGELGRAP